MLDCRLTDEEKAHFLRKLKRLEDERKRGWESHWRDLARHFLPRRSRFLDSGAETNSGQVMNQLETGMAIRALRTLANGMQSGLTSPSRPWFALTFEDPALAETRAAREWLQDTYEKMVSVFARSNFYDQVHILYSELACFGTAVLVIEEDHQNLMRCRTLTAGEYALDAGADGRIDTIYRRIRMTPRQVVQAWPETCPDTIRHKAEKDSTEWLTILHAVEPNKGHEKGNSKRDKRPWRSLYMVLEGAGREVLEDSGYYEFPALCPRWIVTASDVYGSSPAMDALGDCRQLQRVVKDARIARELSNNPPWLVSVNSVVGTPDTSPGALNFTSGLTKGQEAMRPLLQFNPAFQAIEAEKQELRQEIEKHFHNDLFLMISEAGRNMTATEVAERNGEKMLMLGPVLDRLRSELFQPLIERVYGIMDRAGLVAFPDESLSSQPVKVEFISILAQAQKQAGLTDIDQLLGRIGQLAQLTQSPDAIDKVNTDLIVDTYAELLGTPPSLILSAQEVEQKRQARAEQMQQAQQMQQASQGIDMAARGAEAMQAMAAAGGEIDAGALSALGADSGLMPPGL